MTGSMYFLFHTEKCVHCGASPLISNRKQKTATEKKNQQPKHTNQAETKKPANPKQEQNTTIRNDNPKAAMRRNDKAACVPSPERVILETTAQGRNLTRCREVPSKKVVVQKLEIPPARIPEIAS